MSSKQNATTNAKSTQSLARDYRKAYVKLLTAAANTAKTVDNFFFVEDSETSDEVRPWFYGSLSFLAAIALFVHVAIS